MRSTIHLVSAEDYPRLWPLMRRVLAANFRGSPFRKALATVELDELLGMGRELLAQQPRTRAELGPLLAKRWPGVDQASLTYAISYLTPIIQVPPRGLWRQSGAPRWTTADTWLDAAVDEQLRLEPVIRRYLAAFGPATVREIQAWCGLTRLRPTIEGMGDELHTFRDEDGNELFDVPAAPLPDPDTPAPPRFLPPFDNATLSHADRRRIIPSDQRDTVHLDRLMRTFLVDGFVAGTWYLEQNTPRIEPIKPPAKPDRVALNDEAERLHAFLNS
jgi:hypothetical protein